MRLILELQCEPKIVFIFYGKLKIVAHENEKCTINKCVKCVLIFQSWSGGRKSDSTKMMTTYRWKQLPKIVDNK